MHHYRHFLSETLLEHTATRICILLSDDGFNLFLLQRSEDLDVALRILVWYVEPELVELVRRSAIAVEPHVATFRLTKLATVALGDKRTGEGKALVAVHAANEFRTCGDVTPLICTTQLELAVLVLVEVVEIVALQELVGELREAQTITCLTVEALLYRLLRHHVVDGDVFTNITYESEEREVLHPVVVVDELSTVGCIAIKIKEVRELLLDASHIVTQGLLVEEIALLALTRRVTNHTCSTSNEGKGFVATTLEVAKHHHTAEVSDVERIGSGVDAEVSSHLFLLEQFVSARHHLVYHPTPCEFLYEIFHDFVCLFFSDLVVSVFRFEVQSYSFSVANEEDLCVFSTKNTLFTLFSRKNNLHVRENA